MIVPATLLHIGATTPIEFQKLFDKEDKKLVTQIMDIAVLGHPLHLSIPLTINISFKNYSLDVIGEFVFDQYNNLSPYFPVRSKKTEEEIEKRMNYDQMCKENNQTEHMVFFCENLLSKKKDVKSDIFYYPSFLKENVSTYRHLLHARRNWSDNRTNLMMIFEHHYKKITPEQLLQFLKKLNLTKAEIDKKNKLGNSILAYALFYGCEICADYLITQGANINEVDYAGRDLFYYAVAGNSVKYMRLLSKDTKKWSYPPQRVGNTFDKIDIVNSQHKNIIALASSFKSYDALQELFKYITIDELDLSRLSSDAISNEEGRILDIILNQMTASQKERNKISEKLQKAVDNLTPDMKKKHHEFYNVLLKHTKNITNKFASTDTLKLQATILNYNQLSFKVTQNKLTPEDELKNQEFISKQKTNWMFVFKDKNNKVLNTLYFQFKRKDKYEKSFANRHVRISYKYKPDIHKIELVHKNKVLAESNANDLHEYESRATVFSDPKTLMSFLGFALKEGLEFSNAYLFSSDVGRQEDQYYHLDLRADYWLRLRDKSNILIAEYSAYTGTLSEDNSSEEQKLRAITGNIPYAKSVFFLEAVSPLKKEQILKRNSLTHLLLNQQLEFWYMPDFKDEEMLRDSLNKIFKDVDEYLLKNDFKSAHAKLATIEKLVPKKIRSYKSEMPLSISGNEFLKAVNEEIQRIKSSTKSKTTKNSDLSIEVKLTASQDMKYLLTEATTKESSDVFEEDFIKDKKYKVGLYTPKDVLIAEKFFDYFAEPAPKCLDKCTVNIYYRAYIKFNFHPEAKKIKIFKNSTQIDEAEIKPHTEL